MRILKKIFRFARRNPWKKTGVLVLTGVPAVTLMALAVFFVVMFVTTVVSQVTAAKQDEYRLCGVVLDLPGQNQKTGVYSVYLRDAQAVEVPTRAAYERLKVGEEYTFFFRKNLKLVALEPGHLCQ